MNISDVLIFNKVATTLSFSRAAKQVGSSRSAVSKKISRLEKDLGVVLVNRSTRSVALTEAGRTFHQQTSEIDEKIERAADAVRRDKLQPNGTVAFTLPSSLGAALMPALVTQFQPAWPELKFNIHLDDRMVDLIAGSFDLAIRVSQKLGDSNLVSRRIASTRKVLAASPGYLEKFGVPMNIGELKDHRCLGLGNAVNHGTTWRFREHDELVNLPITFSGSANSNLTLILSACLDNGVVYLPEICISGELIRQQLQTILPDSVDPKPCGIYAIYPHRNAAAKVKVLVDFIEAELGAMASETRGAHASKNMRSCIGNTVFP